MNTNYQDCRRPADCSGHVRTYAKLLYMAERTPTTHDVRRFVIVQWALAGIFMLVMGVISQQLAQPQPAYPPIWLIAALMIVVVACAVAAERAFIYVTPLNPDDPPEAWQEQGMRVFTQQTGRALMICVIPLLISAIISVAWSTRWGPWPIIVTAIPALTVLAWETWPHSRNTSLIAAMLDAHGADCQLVARFLRS